MSEQKIVRVVVVGVGSVAQIRHLPEYAENPNAELAGIYDPNEKRAAELAERYGCRVYGSLEEVLADGSIDAVSICSPNTTHAPYSLRAMEAGKHVLVEKPMCISRAEGHALLETAERTGRILMPDHNQRLVRTHRKAKELLQENAIGDLLFFQCNYKHPGPEVWTADSGNGTWFFREDLAHFGVMGDLGAHKIDLIRYLTDSEIQSVVADLHTMDKKGPDGQPIRLDDNAVCMFNMANGLPGIMNFSWTNYGREDNGVTIYGTRGVMKIFGDYNEDIVLEMRDGVQIRYSVGTPGVDPMNSHSGVIDEFISAIVEGRQPVVTALDGYKTVAVLETAVQSAKEGKWLEIQY